MNDDFEASPEARQYRRVPLTLEVQYRTTGSFLVSYSLNLSLGGLFLETDQVLPIGSRLMVRFRVPGVREVVETHAIVMWRRARLSDDDPPAGLGLQFEGIEERMGTLIDDLVRDFDRVRLIAVAGTVSALDRLARYLRSALSCDVGLVTPSEVAAHGFHPSPDLILVDLDSTGPDGFAALERAVSTNTRPPVVAISRDTQTAAQALSAGAAAILEAPLTFDGARQCILHVLARPTTAKNC